MIADTARPQHRYPRLSRVVVGLDGSPEAEASLPYAILLQRAGAALTLVVVPDGDVAPETLQAYAERVAAILRESGPVEIEVVGSGPARTLVERAASSDADLVLVARHGRGGVARARDIPLGSVPARLFSELACGLLVIPAMAEAQPGRAFALGEA